MIFDTFNLSYVIASEIAVFKLNLQCLNLQCLNLSANKNDEPSTSVHLGLYYLVPYEQRVTSC